MKGKPRFLLQIDWRCLADFWKQVCDRLNKIIHNRGHHRLILVLKKSIHLQNGWGYSR